MSAPHRPSRFRVVSVAPLGQVEADPFLTDSEAEAVAEASSRVGPNVTQVTVEFSAPGDVDTFAMRHFVWADGKARDKGWRGWLHREFLGDCMPDDLQAKAEAVTS